MASKEVKQLIKAIEKQGFRVRPTTKGHYQVYKGDTFVTVLPGTPSDHRSLKNSLTYLRRAGFQKPR
ncbi:hypothetical protein ACFV9E_03490 [Streptomyces sp. NPDC059835]|uniref:hypothetical protein n=1 Tax=Streptomyces sp. NPDC059835 TaxID=3346967 RepID=UPI003649CD6E